MNREEALAVVTRHVDHRDLEEDDIDEAFRVLAQPCIELEGLEIVEDRDVPPGPTDAYGELAWEVRVRPGDQVVVLRRRS